jgi:hypothetical protein
MSGSAAANETIDLGPYDTFVNMEQGGMTRSGEAEEMERRTTGIQICVKLKTSHFQSAHNRE